LFKRYWPRDHLCNQTLQLSSMWFQQLKHLQPSSIQYQGKAGIIRSTWLVRLLTFHKSPSDLRWPIPRLWICACRSSSSSPDTPWQIPWKCRSKGARDDEVRQNHPTGARADKGRSGSSTHTKCLSSIRQGCWPTGNVSRWGSASKRGDSKSARVVHSSNMGGNPMRAQVATNEDDTVGSVMQAIRCAAKLMRGVD